MKANTSTSQKIGAAIFAIGAGANGGSAAVGYGHQVFVQTRNGPGESGPSNVQAGTTFQQTLPAPQNVQATLLDAYTVQISWDPGPAGTSAVVEVNRLGETGYHVVGTASNAGPFTDTHMDPNSYAYRVKFVQGNNESPYSLDTFRVSTAGFSMTLHTVYLPVTEK